MRYLSLFDDFSKVEESYHFDGNSILESKVNQMLFLKNNGCTVGFTLNEFKEFFGSQSLLENKGGYESDLLLEKAYSVYELGMLYESKSHWFDGSRPQVYEHSRNAVPYLEYEGNILLFKDGEAFMISERSLQMLNKGEDISEGFFDEVLYHKLNEWSLFDNPIVNGLKSSVKGLGDWSKKNIVEPAKKAVKAYVVEPLKKTWDVLSDGAKKLYEFSKRIVSAVATFIKENWQDILFYISVALQIIAGIVAFIPAAGQVIGPVLLIIAGALQMVLGTVDVFDGIKITKECPINPYQKAAPEFIKGGSKILGGGISLLLGINDVVTSAKAAVPGAAMTSTAVAIPAKNWVSKTVQSLKVSGAAIGLFETVIKFITEKGGAKLLKAETNVFFKGAGELLGKKLGEKANEAVIPMLCIGGKNALGSIWDLILDGISGIGKLINGILDLPNKTVKGIDEFNKKHSSGIFGKIVGGALNTFVKPVAKVLAWFSDNKIKPIVKPITNWMISIGKNNKTINKNAESKPDLKAAITGKPITQPKGKIDYAKLDLNSSDKKNLNKIKGSDNDKKVTKNIKGVKESLSHIKDFNSYNLGYEIS